MNYLMLILSYLLLRMKELQEKGKKGNCIKTRQTYLYIK